MAEPVKSPEQPDQPVNFRRPPVNEVYLLVQTKAAALPADNLSLLSKTHGDRFPKIQSHQRSDRIREPEPGKQVQLHVEFGRQGGQRLWMLSEDETRLIQIQSDRFVYNWRQVPGHLDYPRYHSIRAGFVTEITALMTALKMDIENADFVDMCEISYANVIESPDIDDIRPQIHRVFREVAQPSLAAPRLSAEEAALIWTYRIDDERDEFVGRMRIAANPVRNLLTGRFALHCHIFYRGRPAAPTLPAVLKFLDEGHLAIVNSFKQITTDEMHAIWEPV